MSETTWNSVFGPYETRETVLAEADRQGITSQDYTTSCVLEAIEQGAELDASEAFADLCGQLEIEVG